MKSLSLVLFSVLSQAAAGIVLISTFLPGAPGARAALPLAALGLAVSLAHLGTPAGALRALANLRTSWLSREVLLTGLFTVSAGVYGYLLSDRVVGLGAGLLGLAALYAQGRVYRLPTRPEWRHVANLCSLFASSLLLGALIVALTGGHNLANLRALGTVILLAAAGVLLALAFWSAHLVRLARGAWVADTWFWVRLVAGVVIPVLGGTGMMLGITPDLLTTGGALAGAIVGEMLGRSMFFRVGMEHMPLF